MINREPNLGHLISFYSSIQNSNGGVDLTFNSFPSLIPNARPPFAPLSTHFEGNPEMRRVPTEVHKVSTTAIRFFNSKAAALKALPDYNKFPYIHPSTPLHMVFSNVGKDKETYVFSKTSDTHNITKAIVPKHTPLEEVVENLKQDKNAAVLLSPAIENETISSVFGSPIYEWETTDDTVTWVFVGATKDGYKSLQALYPVANFEKGSVFKEKNLAVLKTLEATPLTFSSYEEALASTKDFANEQRLPLIEKDTVVCYPLSLNEDITYTILDPQNDRIHLSRKKHKNMDAIKAELKTLPIKNNIVTLESLSLRRALEDKLSSEKRAASPAGHQESKKQKV